MDSLNTQELQVVQAFSSVDVPEEIFKSSNMKDLIEGMLANQKSVGSNTRTLERLRQEKRDGNFVGNWWHDRKDNIQESQLDLNQSIGRLTEKSTQLLIVNTAISKVLNHQQQILLQQQNLLEQQTQELKNQNLQILSQQTILEQQQKEINAANQGLLEAKGITQEQAQKLVGCVVRVTEAEKRVDFSNQELRNIVEQRHADLEQKLDMQIQAVLDKSNAQDEAVQHFHKDIALQFQTIQERMSVQDVAARHLQESLAQQFETHHQDILAIVDKNSQGLHESVNEIELKQKIFQEENTKVLETQRDSVKLDLQHFSVELGGLSDALKNTGVQLLFLQETQHKSEKNNRVALVSLACVALVSLAWQIAQHFA